MGVAVCRVLLGDASVLKEVRLAALLDTPSAFGFTYDDEATRTDEHWMHRGLLASSGRDSTVFLAWMRRKCGRNRRRLPTRPLDRRGRTGVDVDRSGARRSGVGALLVQAVIDWAVDNDEPRSGCGWLRGNSPAESLYQSLGFRATGDYQPCPPTPARTNFECASTSPNPECPRVYDALRPVRHR